LPSNIEDDDLQHPKNTIEFHSSAMQSTVICPQCTQVVGGHRFAMHLEKCMNGGNRSLKKHYDSLDDGFFLQNRKNSKLDPFPDSLIVKIKLRNGGNYFSPLYLIE